MYPHGNKAVIRQVTGSKPAGKITLVRFESRTIHCFELESDFDSYIHLININSFHIRLTFHIC
jgi:hypothetical protein